MRSSQSVWRSNSQLGDVIAVIYVLVLAAVVALTWDGFIAATRAHPYVMGFVKVSLLATFGTLLKVRKASGYWIVDLPLLACRFVIWGLLGCWFAYAFPLISSGVDALMANGTWPDLHFALWAAFSKSLAINFLCGYALTMMVTHEYLDQLAEFLVSGHRFLHPVTFGERLDKKVWFWKIPLSLVAWLAIHTVTFSLDGVYYVLCAALASVILGFILTSRANAK